MTILTWLFAGGLMGWAASFYMSSTELPAIAFNIGVALVGATIGGWLLGPTLGVLPGFSIFAVIVSAMGSGSLLLALHFVQQRRGRAEHFVSSWR
jgi:uncharacterized membrane protein YeaQ/YmgE (transglycosylase-associated protein family)